jgi:hypothetical protein
MTVEALVTFLSCGLANIVTVGHPLGSLCSWPRGHGRFLFGDWPVSVVGRRNFGCHP